MNHLIVFAAVIEKQNGRIRDLSETLSIVVEKVTQLILKKESICTHLSELTKAQIKLKKEIKEKFQVFESNLNFITSRLNSLSLN